MSAHQKVSNEDVRKTIATWRGNVEAAAADLGLTPRNLRKRLERLGISLEAIRSRHSMPGPYGTDPVPSGPMNRPGPNSPTSGGGLYEFPRAAPSLSAMNATAAKADEVPIATVRARQQPTRLRPEQLDELRAAKFDLMGKFKVETDENALLQQFFAEAFAAWLHSKLTGDLP